MDKQSPSPEADFLMTPPRLSGHQLLKIWLELRKEFRSSPEFSKADSPEWRLYHAITQRFTDDASLLKECFVTLPDTTPPVESAWDRFVRKELDKIRKTGELPDYVKFGDG